MSEENATCRKLTLLPKYYELIKSGVKTVEGRLATKSYDEIKEGELIQFSGAGDEELPPITCVVIKKTKYRSFQEMLENEGLGACLPGITDIAEGIAIYRSFPGYAEREEELGAVGFQLKLLP